MAQKTYIVEGRQFRTQADYNKALKDQQMIKAIRNKVDLNNIKQTEQIVKELKAGKYRFYTLLGQDFREELEEKLKTTAQQGAKSSGRKVSANGRGVKQRGKQPLGKGTSDKEVPDSIVKEELKRQERRRRLLVILCSVVSAGCLGYFALYTYYDYKTKQSYEQLSALKEQPVNAANDSAPVIHYTTSDQELPEVLDEYKNLVNKNKKLIGWLKIDDTNINYPVMQTTNNEYYLDHNLNQEYDKNGSIFMDKDCDVLKPSTNTILYGHHMKSGQMFGKLDLYSSEDYYKKHKYIQFDTIYEKGIYEVMYVFRSKIYSEEEIVFKYYQFIDALSQQEFDSYMQEMAAMSFYDTGVTAQYGDELLTLSTCDYYVNDGRFVVVAKRIE